MFRSSTVFRQFSTSLFAFSVILCLSYVSSLIFLSLSFVLPLFLRNCLLLSFVHPQYFVNSLRLCLISLSFLVFPTSVVQFRCLCKPFLLRSVSLPFIVFRSSTVYRQFSTSLFAFSVVLCLSYVRYIFSLPFQPFFLFCVTAVEFSFLLTLYFVNSLRLCLLSLSFFAFCRQLFTL